MPIIRFGATIDGVSLENIENLLKVCQNRVKINLDGTNLVDIFKRSRFASLLT